MKFFEKSVTDALWYNTKVGLITLLFAFPPYGIVNHLYYDRPAINLAIPIDNYLPFNHYWILVYAWVYVFLFLPVFIVRGKESFKYVAKGFIIVNLTSVAIFVLMPARYPRPAIPTQDEFLWWGTALNYLLDKPVNCFPSLHVANAFLASMIAFHYRKRVGIIAWLMAALISVSTLYMKQHFVADIAMGFVLSFSVYRFYFRPRAYTTGNQSPLPEWLSLGVAGIYLFFIGSMYLLFALGVKLPLEKIVR
ncbi:MAG: phosphatase PAP2 family protein [Leptospiraceae bacterium]|nr:phosphatase PAP2 family protein [Leptospiraceae bacterium]HMV37169.1 phosphatase PAP2 family protein [Turneriella sp.]